MKSTKHRFRQLKSMLHREQKMWKRVYQIPSNKCQVNKQTFQIRQPLKTFKEFKQEVRKKIVKLRFNQKF